MRENLPFRGQYYFGGSTKAKPHNFSSSTLPDGKLLHHHVDLPVVIETRGTSYNILIGFCFSHLTPEDSCGDIIDKALDQKLTAERLLGWSSRLFGRWVWISRQDETLIAFSDACATLPIIYHKTKTDTVLGSSSKIIEWFHEGLPPNNDIGPEFRELQKTPGRHAGMSFPLRVTEFSNVFALLPNRYLDLTTTQAIRYYPGARRYGEKKSTEISAEVSQIFMRMLQAVTARHTVSVALTAGFDSRVVAGAAAMTSGLAQKIDFFTFKYPDDPRGQHYDLAKAGDICHAIGANHRVIAAESETASDNVRAMCRDSEEMIATGFEGWVEAIAKEVPEDQLILMGWASEIARCFYRWPGSDAVTPTDLAKCAGVQATPAFLPEFEAWYDECKPVSERSSIAVLDFFYWDNRVARWCGPGLNIMNCGNNWITVFSCRDVLDLMLSAKESERGSAEQIMYRNIVRHMKPELLDIPFNPMGLEDRIKQIYLVKARQKLAWIARATGLIHIVRLLRK